MKKLILVAAISAAFSAGFVHAEEAKVEAKPDNEVSFNAALASDYRYRGISQTRLQAALQGGADCTNNPSGLYVGAWLSNIKWIKDAGGKGNVEVDLYAGKRGEIVNEFVKDISYDIGVLTYVYPSNALATSANTTEVYGQVGYGPAYVKYLHSVTNLFGFADSKNSGYLDLGSNFEIESGLILNAHLGRQMVKNNSNYSYNDWKVGITKDFGIVTTAVAVIGTNAGEVVYASPANGKFLGKTGLVATLSKTF